MNCVAPWAGPTVPVKEDTVNRTLFDFTFGHCRRPARMSLGHRTVNLMETEASHSFSYCSRFEYGGIIVPLYFLSQDVNFFPQLGGLNRGSFFVTRDKLRELQLQLKFETAFKVC